MDKDLEKLENRSKKVREIMAEQPLLYSLWFTCNSSNINDNRCIFICFAQ